MRFWSFIRNEAKPDEVELRIDGDIVDDDEAWIYEWFGIPVASPNAFREELAQFVGKNITVWINSYGGSVFAATGMYNALEAHKATGSTVTTIGDAKVMSAAMTIFMAGDKRKASPGCIFMVHNPLTYASGYASDLRKVADILDIVKESIMNAYEKSGLSRDKLSALMDDETYMSAKTAVSQGFATEVLTWATESAAAGDIVNFSFPRLAIQNAANDSMRKFCDLAKKLEVAQLPANAAGDDKSILAEAKKFLAAMGLSFSSKHKIEKEEPDLEIKNAEDLRKAHPDLVNEIVNQVRADAVKNEQDRIAALDALDDGTNPIVTALVVDAKASGKTADDIKNAVDIVKKNAAPPAAQSPENNGENWLKRLAADTTNSGVNGVGTEAAGGQSSAQEEAAVVNFMAEVINKKNGGKK